MSVAEAQLYERVHYRHDPRWLLPGQEDGEASLCLACVIEMIEDVTVSVIRKKYVLSGFQMFLENKTSAVLGVLTNDGRICIRFMRQLLGMLVNVENATALNLITEVLVQLTVSLKLEKFVHCVLDICKKELSQVGNTRLSLPMFNFLGKLADAMPSLAEILVTDHYNLVEHLPEGLMCPNEGLKASVCYLYGKLYSSPTATEKLIAHFTDKLCGIFLSTLENAQTKELQLNCMGLLKQLLSFDQFVSIVMNSSIWLEDSEDTPTLQAQNPLPLVLKKILLSREEVLQIASAQCIAAVLVHSPAKYAPSFILADIPEFLFENLSNTSEALIWSIYCCLLLMTEERLFFSKCHTAYGIEAVLRSLKQILQINNMELHKQGLLLLTEILKRQPIEIKLFTNPGIFKAAVDVLKEAVNSPVLEVATEASRAISAFLRKDHLSIPVQYDELEKLLSRIFERCADLHCTSVTRRPSKHQINRDEIRSMSRQGHLLTNALEIFHKACRLSLDCGCDSTAHENAFTAPSSASTDTLEIFSWYLLNTCDNFCIPTVLRCYEWTPVPATMEIFFSLLTDIFAVVPSMKEKVSVKLASSSFIRLAMEVKSTLCSGQRNINLNNTCSNFLCYLCSTLWEVMAAGETNSQKEVSDVLKKSMIDIDGSKAESISVLLESPNNCTNSQALRCHQEALLVIISIAYLMEDRFIPETDLFWAILSFLHSMQSQGEHVSPYVLRGALYLLSQCQEKCETLNTISLNVICKILENVPEIHLVYFHHPIFLKFFLRYPQLMQKYGRQVMELWIIQEDCSVVSEKNPKASNVAKLMPATQCTSNPILSILHSYPNVILILLDLLYSGSVDLADKVLVILQTFLHEKNKFPASNLLINYILQTLQETLISSNLQEKKNLPLILSLLCLMQHENTADSVMDGTYFKLLYHVSNISGKCNSSNVSILKPALNFLHCSLHQASTSWKKRATSVLLSNNSLIELLEQILERTLDGAKTSASELCETLCCSAWQITSSLICFQQCYNLQVHKTVHVNVHNVVNLISFKYKDTSSLLMVSLLQLFKSLLSQKFSSPLVTMLPEKDSQVLTDMEAAIQPLSTQSTLYLVAALQNLMIQKDTLLVQATIDCFGSLLDFLYDKAVDLALHVASQPWNRSVLLVFLHCKENGYLQPGVLRFMALVSVHDERSCRPESR
ncbi:meiosis inhibitor protein 1 isoform X2 [Pseudophryne corroboree]|uniref:meiosis inhibitor protein 1 isoform X2 n=1 Tax=Pseudophryne corroboree TaxID=495146 RepID=UPI0030817218